jgi:hypothetical protein
MSHGCGAGSIDVASLSLPGGPVLLRGETRYERKRVAGDRLPDPESPVLSWLKICVTPDWDIGRLKHPVKPVHGR